MDPATMGCPNLQCDNYLAPEEESSSEVCSVCSGAGKMPVGETETAICNACQGTGQEQV